MSFLKLLFKGWLVKKFGMKLVAGAFMLILLIVAFIVGMVVLFSI